MTLWVKVRVRRPNDEKGTRTLQGDEPIEYNWEVRSRSTRGGDPSIRTVIWDSKVSYHSSGYDTTSMD